MEWYCCPSQHTLHIAYSHWTWAFLNRFPCISIRRATSGCGNTLREKITQFQISELLEKSYGRAESAANAVTGFARTGVWPVDPNVFQDSDFTTSTQVSYPSAGPTNSVTECQAATSSNPRQENKGPKQSRQLLTGRLKKYHLCLKAME
jgi:hypothetical protein